MTIVRRTHVLRPRRGAPVAVLIAVLFALVCPLAGRSEAMAGVGGYVPLSPTRILSTRDGVGDITGALAGGGFYDQQILGRGGVPSTGVDAVVMNVTVIAGSSPGFVTLYPSGGAFPPTSNVNFTPGQIVPNLVHVKVGANGKVSIFNSAGSNHVIFDVAGYYTAAGRPDADGFVALATPERLFDSRSDPTFDDRGNSLGIGPLTARDTVSIDVDDDNEIDAVALNITATGASAPTFVTVYPGGAGATLPIASNLNVVAQQTVANAAIVRLGSDGSFVVYNNSGAVDVVVDITGYYLKPPVGGAQSRFVALSPSRILSTRDGIGASGKLNQTSLSFKVTGKGGLPNSTSVLAVVMNVTATRPDVPGYLTVYPGGTVLPASSSLNFTAGQSVANQVIVGVGPGGTVNVFNSAGTTDVIYDVFGYFVSSTASLTDVALELTPGDEGAAATAPASTGRPPVVFADVRAIRGQGA